MVPTTTSEFKDVPPVLSDGGLICSCCGECELLGTLKDMEAYIKVHIDRQTVRDSEYFTCLIYDEFTLYVATPPRSSSGDYIWRVRDLEISGDIKVLWEANKQLWLLKQKHFWFMPILLQPSFSISVLDTEKPDSPFLICPGFHL
ncbi:hypothetical protein F53441_13964 [Fusarium austroafricanum]|uniref:Uncharacterized protein n=1 Tax=Fusarium austroafricanum TaxID=2364996 RepID=A0A8H4JIF1_9HYPO|nr:hypothetical protein F53441_13964 [Fusarium austroafricanum]